MIRRPPKQMVVPEKFSKNMPLSSPTSHKSKTWERLLIPDNIATISKVHGISLYFRQGKMETSKSDQLNLKM